MDKNQTDETEKKEKRYDTSILKKKYEESPFIAEDRFKIPIKKKGIKMDTAGPLAIMDTSTGEMKEVSEIRRITEVDGEQFVKLYTAHLGAFFDLKPGTHKLVYALLDELGKSRYANGDTIYINYDQIVRYYDKVSAKAPAKSTYMLALAELTEKGFVAPSKDRNLWFINPALFFNGNRVRFVNEFRKKKVSNQQKLEAEGQQNWLEDQRENGGGDESG